DVLSKRFAIALACVSSDGYESSVNVAYATTARGIFDMVTYAYGCTKGTDSDSQTNNAFGTLSNMPNGASYYRWGTPLTNSINQAVATAGPPTYSIYYALPSYRYADLVMGAASAPDSGLTRVVFWRDLYPGGSDYTALDVDFLNNGVDVGSANLSLS